MIPKKSELGKTEEKDFRMTLNRTGELSFVKPAIDVNISSTAGLPDPERVRAGAEQMKNGFQMQVEGTIKALQGTFEYYGRPKRNQFGTLSVSGTKDPVKIAFESEGIFFPILSISRVKPALRVA